MIEREGERSKMIYLRDRKKEMDRWMDGLVIECAFSLFFYSVDF